MMIYIEQWKGIFYRLVDDSGYRLGVAQPEFIEELGLTDEDFKEGQRIQLAVKKGEDDRLDMEGRSL